MHGIQNILCFCKRYLLSILQSQALHAEEVRLVSLPGRQTAELVQVVNHHQGALTVTGKKQNIALLSQVKERGVEVKGVTFHRLVLNFQLTESNLSVA